jgi:hypothetical protein
MTVLRTLPSRITGAKAHQCFCSSQEIALQPASKAQKKAANAHFVHFRRFLPIALPSFSSSTP